MSREVMKLALEALEKYHTGISILNDGPDDSDVAHAQGLIFKSMDLTLLAIPALRKAIEEAEKQETTGEHGVRVIGKVCKTNEPARGTLASQALEPK